MPPSAPSGIAGSPPDAALVGAGPRLYSGEHNCVCFCVWVCAILSYAFFVVAYKSVCEHVCVTALLLDLHASVCVCDRGHVALLSVKEAACGIKSE